MSKHPACELERRGRRSDGVKWDVEQNHSLANQGKYPSTLILRSNAATIDCILVLQKWCLAWKNTQTKNYFSQLALCHSVKEKKCLTVAHMQYLVAKQKEVYISSQGQALLGSKASGNF